VDKPPENPLFESDINSRAGSRLPPTGSAPVPTQDGKNRPFPQFETKMVSLGKGQQPPEMEMPPAQAPEPEPKSQTPPDQKAEKEPGKQTPVEATPTPAVPKPTPTPIPSTKKQQSADMLAVAATPTPEPSPTPTPDDTPNDEIPKPTPVQPEMHKPKVQDLVMLTKQTPRRQRQRQPKYQPETEQTRVEGFLSNRAEKPGLDMASSPLGRYRRIVTDAIGQRWYFYVQQNMDLIPVGTVHIKLEINEQGHAEDIKILSNTSSGAFGDFTVQSISEAELPPLPPDLAPKLKDGRLEFEFTFTIYPD
jgi:hypothetical protein